MHNIQPANQPIKLVVLLGDCLSCVALCLSLDQGSDWAMWASGLTLQG